MALWHWVLIALTAILVSLLVWWQIYRYRNRYVGAGWVLSYNRKEKHVVARSRLLGSPAHKAGIHNWDIITELNGKRLQFNSEQEIKAFFEDVLNNRPVVGDRIFGKVLRGRLIKENGEERTTLVEEPFEMKAEVIQGPIPIRATWADVARYQGDCRVHIGMAYCTKTDQLFPTMGLTDQAIKEIIP